MRLAQPGEHKQKQTEGSVPDAKHDLLGDASSRLSWRSVEGIQSAFDQRLRDVACAAVLMTAERVGPSRSDSAMLSLHSKSHKMQPALPVESLLDMLLTYQGHGLRVEGLVDMRAVKVL